MGTLTEERFLKLGRALPIRLPRQKPLFYQDFDCESDLADWWISTGFSPLTWEVSPTSAYRSRKSLHCLHSAVAARMEGGDLNHPPMSPSVIRFAAFVVTPHLYVYARLGGTVIWSVRFHTNWQIQFPSATDRQAYLANTWYLIEVVMDWAAETCDLYVDGTYLVTVAFLFSTKQMDNLIVFGYGLNSEFYFDELGFS